MTHEDQVALEILSESAVESARRGAGRRAVASPHRRDACSAPALPETVMTVSHGPQSLHAQAADKGGRQEETGRRRGFRAARTDSIRPAADSINEQPSR